MDEQNRKVKFTDAIRGNQKPSLEKKNAIQWPRAKEPPNPHPPPAKMVDKLLQRKLKIAYDNFLCQFIVTY